MSTIKTYSELIRLHTFKDRFDYLNLHGVIGEETFGFERIFNQRFYRSKEWHMIRDKVILRDNGCDLGVPDHDIYGQYIVHHMNPIGIKDLENHSDILFDPEYLITTCIATHNAIHYGDYSKLDNPLIERYPNDTCPWKGISHG